MTEWIEWNGGECPIKSDKTWVEYKFKGGVEGLSKRANLRWSHIGSPYDITSYRITDDREPMAQTREQITAQIDALQKQLAAMPVMTTMYYSKYSCSPHLRDHKYRFDIETINGIPHIHGVAMKECWK